MSRISYSEEEDYPGQFNLFRANVNRSIAGRGGQAALRDLEAALLAMSNKRLISHAFIKHDEVCAVGALVVARLAAKGRPEVEVRAELESEHTYCLRANWVCGHTRSRHIDDGACAECISYKEKYPDWFEGAYPRTLCEGFVSESEDVSDDDDEGETEAAAVKVGVPEMVAWRLVELNDYELDRETPEERYEHVLKWVQRRLKQDLAQAMREDMV